MIKNDLADMGIEVLKELLMRLLDKFLPGHSVDGSQDQTDLQYILDKIKETQGAKLEPVTPVPDPSGDGS